MKKHLTIIILGLIAALTLLCSQPYQASAQEDLGASQVCEGHTLGEVNGCPACVNGENLHICENNFPDANFRNFLLVEYGNEEEEIETKLWILSLDCSSEDIVSLRGIEYFGDLQSLYCPYNQLSSLDVSKNTALTYLNCASNQLSNLDVSKNTALTYLDCTSNQLSSLNVSKNTALTWLDCYFNQLNSLDVSKNTLLTRLWCFSNQLSSLDVSRNTALESLNCASNPLSSLNVNKNTALVYLNCASNQLSTLDVSKNTSLNMLNCFSNQLSSLDVSKNTALTYLNCASNQLSNLDVSRNTALESLNCYSNQLSSLDVSKNTALKIFWCDSNRLSILDLSKNTQLYDPIIDQSLTFPGIVPGEFDLSALVGKENIGRIAEVGTDHLDSDTGKPLVEYDAESGIVTLETSEFYYLFDTGNETAGTMRVDVSIIELVPPTGEVLNEAADVGDDTATVIMDVDKQEKEFSAEEEKQISEAIGQTAGFEIISCFEITVSAVHYDEDGNEVSREAITQLKSAVPLTFVTPNAEGMKYRVVRVHTNPDGSVEVDLLDTRDNGDGTVSADSDRFSLYYLVEVEELEYIPGDITGDGKVNIFDVVRLLKKSTGENVQTFANPDVTGDGKINIFDVVRLLKFVTGEKVEVF